MPAISDDISSIESLLLTFGSFKLDCTREKNVVFEMHMPVQIVFKFPESVEERVVHRAGIFGCDEIAAQAADLCQENPGTFVCLDKQGEGTPNGTTRFSRLDFTTHPFPFDLYDHWKYDNLLFSQVLGQLLGELRQLRADGRQPRRR